MSPVIKKCLPILDKAFRESNELAGGMNYRYLHGLRTMLACEQIINSPELRNKKIDRESLFIAALFHDIGKVIHIEQDGTLQGDRSGDAISHEEMGARILKDYIGNLLSEKQVEKIANMIRNQHDPKPDDYEIKVLSDADILDSIGLINVWRMFTYSGKKSRSLEETLDYYKSTSGDKTRQEKIYFSFTKRVANDRRSRLKKFIKEFIKEYKSKDLGV
ncbi:HD domain-containing protein [Patescibacteria group bacterium]|nr:HD domain-containing protein [Patescibacteria group bacterium]